MLTSLYSDYYCVYDKYSLFCSFNIHDQEWILMRIIFSADEFIFLSIVFIDRYSKMQQKTKRANSKFSEFPHQISIALPHHRPYAIRSENALKRNRNAHTTYYDKWMTERACSSRHVLSIILQLLTTWCSQLTQLFFWIYTKKKSNTTRRDAFAVTHFYSVWQTDCRTKRKLATQFGVP